MKEAVKVVSGVDLSKDGNKGKSESVDKPSEAVEKKMMWRKVLRKIRWGKQLLPSMK